MNTKRKHIKIFTAFFLGFYSLFIFYAALHTHGIRTYSNIINIEVGHEEESHHPYLDSENNCRLVSFANSLYSFSEYSTESEIFYFSYANIHFDCAAKPLLTYKESLQLRAPPSVS